MTSLKFANNCVGSTTKNLKAGVESASETSRLLGISSGSEQCDVTSKETL